MFSNFSLYGLTSYCSACFTVLGSIVFGVHLVDKNFVTFLFAIILILISIIFGIYSTKYFDKTYQLKKNAKKIIKK